MARDPKRYEPPPNGGDHGTAYPFPVVLPDDRVLITTGQGEGRVLLVALDPEWLCETSKDSSFDLPASTAETEVPIDGTRLPEEWSAFGCAGVDVVADPEGGSRAAVQVERSHPDWPACVVWNHPLGRRGSLHLRCRLAPNSAGGRLLLTDHFSVPFDPEDALRATFVLRVGPATQALFPLEYAADSEPLVPGESALVAEADVWHDIHLSWDCDQRLATATLGAQQVELPQQVMGDGVCYLRIRPAGLAVDGGFLVSRVEVIVEPASHNTVGAS